MTNERAAKIPWIFSPMWLH